MSKELCKECKLRFAKKYYEKKIDILEAELNNPINFMYGKTKLMFHPRESFTKVQNLGHKLVGFEDEIRYLKKEIDSITDKSDCFEIMYDKYKKENIKLKEQLKSCLSVPDTTLEELKEEKEFFSIGDK